MFERYSHLYRNSDTPVHATVATDVHSKENLKYKLVTRFDDGKSEYRVFPSLVAFMRYYGTTTDPRMLHEVIFSGRQRIKFDIDCSAAQLATIMQGAIGIMGSDTPSTPTSADYRVVIEHFITAIKDSFFNSYDIALEDDDFAICESSREGVKYSTHIILPKYAVSSNTQAHDFALQTRNFVPHKLWSIMDVGVYNSTQSFRMLGSQKSDGRVKKLITNHTPEDTIISALHPAIIRSTTLLPDITTARAAHVEIDLHPDDIKAVLDECSRAGLLDDHQFKRNRGTLFMFDRTRPGVCDICSERLGEHHEHTVDATLSVFVYYEQGNMINIYRQCRRDRQSAAIDGSKRITKMVGSVLSSVMRAEPMEIDPAQPSRRWIDREIMRAIDHSVAPVTKFMTYANGSSAGASAPGLPPLTRNVYCDDSLRDFEHTPTLVVHAPMKIGKTKKLREHITARFSDPAAKIVFVSFRQTFSSNIKEKFPEFTLYSDVKGPLDHSRVIVQVESLHRIIIREGQAPPDLLVLDECESIFEQFNSGLLRGNFNECFAKFLYLVRSSAHVICMDAMVTNRTYNVLREFRPLAPITYHRNTVQNSSTDAYYLFGDKAKWLLTLYRAIDAKQKIAIPISSLTEAKGIVETIKTAYPHLQVGFYSSETTYRDRRDHFGRVNDVWSQYDVLVYTPTISAGVSYEQKHFDSVFGFFTDQSCPVETCVQMLGRVRNVTSKNYFIYMDAKGAALPITRKDVIARLQDTRADLFRDLDATGAMTVEYTATGAKQLHTGPYFTLWVENVIARNTSRNSFVRKFVSYLRQCGCDIEHVSADNFQDMLEGCDLPADDALDAPIEVCLRSVVATHAHAKTQVKDREYEAIASADDIDHDIATDLSSRVQNQIDITADERNNLSKYWLKTVYNIQWEITPAFVATYRNPKMVKIYKNLCKITKFLDTKPADCVAEPLDYVLRELQAEERGMHGYLMSNSREDDDLNKNYAFTQHYIAIGLLKIFGWSSIYDGGYQGKNTVIYRIRENRTLIAKFVTDGAVEFNIRKPLLRWDSGPSPPPDSSDTTYADRLLSDVVKFTSSVITAMYGMKIATSGDLLRIVRPSEFTECHDVSRVKRIPCYGTDPADIPIVVTADIDDDAEIVVIEDM